MSFKEILVEQFYAQERHPEALHQAFFGSQYIGQVSFLSRDEVISLGSELDLRPGKRLLDLGCGRGGPGIELARYFGCAIMGVDVNARHVELANDLARSADLQDRAIFLHGEWSQLSASIMPAFDSVLMLDSLVHFEDRLSLFRSVRNLCAPDAKFAIATELICGEVDPQDIAWRERSGKVKCITEEELGRELTMTGWHITRQDWLPGRRLQLSSFGLDYFGRDNTTNFEHLAAIERVSVDDAAIESIIYASPCGPRDTFVTR